MLRRLDRDCAVDFPPHVPVDTLSADELRDVVVRAARGYRNWTCAKQEFPKATRQISLEIGDLLLVGGEVRTRGVLLFWIRNMVKLLPGGQHLVAHVGDTLGCWHIPSQRNIWSQLTSAFGTHGIEFDAGYDLTGQHIRVAAVSQVRDEGRYSADSLVMPRLIGDEHII